MHTAHIPRRRKRPGQFTRSQVIFSPRARTCTPYIEARSNISEEIDVFIELHTRRDEYLRENRYITQKRGVVVGPTRLKVFRRCTIIHFISSLAQLSVLTCLSSTTQSNLRLIYPGRSILTLIGLWIWRWSSFLVLHRFRAISTTLVEKKWFKKEQALSSMRR